MFGKKNKFSFIDTAQLELIESAQKRIRQKKGLYVHFIIFLIITLLLVTANLILGIHKDFTIAGLNWFVYPVLAWSFFLIYHLIAVFITHKFMNKAWEKQQINKLVNKQQARIEKLSRNLLQEDHKAIEKSDSPKQQNLIIKEPTKKVSKLTIIAAAGEDNAIGKDNGLIWHLSKDLQRFKSLTNGHHIIMGRKTFESFTKPLPNRTHVIITRQDNYKVPEDVIVVNTLEQAIEVTRNDMQPFIIGGGEIYNQSIHLANLIELTRVHATFNTADTFFPEIDGRLWKEIGRTTHDIDDKHAHAFSFISYEKR